MSECTGMCLNMPEPLFKCITFLTEIFPYKQRNEEVDMSNSTVQYNSGHVYDGNEW